MEDRQNQEVVDKKRKTGWKKEGKFAGLNEKRSAGRAAAREEKQRLGIPVRLPKPKKALALEDKAVGDSVITTCDKCVGESVWGDPFLVMTIMDLEPK